MLTLPVTTTSYHKMFFMTLCLPSLECEELISISPPLFFLNSSQFYWLVQRKERSRGGRTWKTSLLRVKRGLVVIPRVSYCPDANLLKCVRVQKRKWPKRLHILNVIIFLFSYCLSLPLEVNSMKLRIFICFASAMFPICCCLVAIHVWLLGPHGL